MIYLVLFIKRSQAGNKKITTYGTAGLPLASLRRNEEGRQVGQEPDGSHSSLGTPFPVKHISTTSFRLGGALTPLWALLWVRKDPWERERRRKSCYRSSFMKISSFLAGL